MNSQIRLFHRRSCVPAELTDVFRAYFSRNQGAQGVAPKYGVEVLGAADENRRIEVLLTFKSGERYCCSEPVCHFGPNWQGLRDIASALKVDLGAPLKIILNCIVEEGSRFNVLQSFGLPAESHAWRCCAEFCEAETISE